MGRRGFTLIEVISALVIFSAGVLVAASMSQNLSLQIRNATLRSEATLIGRQTLDSLSTVPYTSFTTGSTVEGTVTVEGRTYTRRWSVIQDGVRMRRVDVEVDAPGSDVPLYPGGCDTSYCASFYVVEPW